ncbi:MAG: heme ABC transporter ATP-binding protein [Pseudomonadales bacterium]|nr:heme ABC transporter ATP-binding protein [Pseudomonadales bacterium]
MKIEGEHLSLQSGGKTLLDDVSFCAEPSQLTVIVGPNGAGKSTLLDVISGYRTPDSGMVRWNGTPVQEMSLAERAVRAAILPQNSVLNFPFTVREVIGMGCIPLSPASDTPQLIDAVIQELGLREMADQQFTTLSGGEQQRVQTGRVLTQIWNRQDAILMLDEPVAALDIAFQYQVLGLVRRFVTRGCTGLLILHDMNLVLRYADQVILMAEGSIQSHGPAAEVLTSALFQDIMSVSSTLLQTAQGQQYLVLSPPG